MKYAENSANVCVKMLNSLEIILMYVIEDEGQGVRQARLYRYNFRLIHSTEVTRHACTYRKSTYHIAGHIRWGKILAIYKVDPVLQILKLAENLIEHFRRGVTMRPYVMYYKWQLQKSS